MRRLNVDWRFHDMRAMAASDATQGVLGQRMDIVRASVRRETTQPSAYAVAKYALRPAGRIQWWAMQDLNLQPTD